MLAPGLQAFFLLISIFIVIAISVSQSKGTGQIAGSASQTESTGKISALSVLNLIILLQCLLVTTVLLVIPLVYDRFGNLKALARSLRQIRFALIMSIIQVFFLLLFALINTASANTGTWLLFCTKCASEEVVTGGCSKNVADDKASPASLCRNKRALTAFLFFACFSWVCNLLAVYDSGSIRCRPFRSSSPFSSSGPLSAL